MTLADVAERAGVSRATASRALADDPRISPPTRATVRAAAESLRYVPNAAARSLRVRRTRTLGLLLADLGDPVHGQMAAGFEVGAASHGYGHLRRGPTCRTRSGAPSTCSWNTARMASRWCRASWTPGRPGSAGAGRPLVIVQPDGPGILRLRSNPPDGLIQTDDAGGVQAATRYLLAAGHRRIVYPGAGGRSTNTVRQESVLQVLHEAGIESPPTITLAEDAWRDPDAVAAALGTDLPDAVMCYDDKLALALLDGLRPRGIRVPGDVAVVGFDGIPFAALANPRLTTVSTPSNELGWLAARSLVHAIRDGRLPPGRVLATELVVRESVRSVPGSVAAGSPAPAGTARVAS